MALAVPENMASVHLMNVADKYSLLHRSCLYPCSDITISLTANIARPLPAYYQRLTTLTLAHPGAYC